jgi:restriction endonuclease Mrr
VKLTTPARTFEDDPATAPAQVESIPSASILNRLKERIIEISKMAPQRRGYAFEAFLKDVFDAYGMAGKAAFRLTGEQIDGSFEYGHQTYLLEAKWQNDKTAAKDLRDFHGKLDGKAVWARGLFISNSGFTEEGLQSFGNGKWIICMDGRDLYEIFHNQRSFIEVFRLKLRAAAETGRPFVRVCELYTV